MRSLRNPIILLPVCFLFLLPVSAYAQVPEGYYDAAAGKSGAELKTALFSIIKSPKVISYSRLWKAFEKTDARANGKVWDMYSAHRIGGGHYFDFLADRCGTYKTEGDCYNREHSVPKSWFKEAPPMHSDLFHLYPTDGYVNNRRGNLPFGEVGITYWTSANGSKVGQNTAGNYTKTVFEPVDEYKGDFARTYFYMVTAYEDKIENWRSDQIGGKAYPGFTPWSLEMLLRWHRDDPVSDKEIRRNEEVFKIQKNRNPYIDYPQLAEYVWGRRVQSAFSPDAEASSLFLEEYSPFERWLQWMGKFFNRWQK